MICDICQKNSATVHLTEIVNDKVVEMHICQACASFKAEELNVQFNISDFLGGLAGTESLRADKQSLRCKSCGFSYEDFKKKGRLGCSRCYSVFKQQLLPLLKKIHSSARHVGKVPGKARQKVSLELDVQELRKRLMRAIKLEEYEEAASLRDKIRKLEKKNNK
jgi:protein arginine kinase activator